MPRKKIPVPADVAAEMRRLNGHLQRLEREKEIAKNTLRDYVTDAHTAGDGSYREIAMVLGVTYPWVKQLVDDTLEARDASGDEPG